MDATKNSVGEMLRDALITPDHLCVSMQKMSKGIFTKKQFDAQFKMRIEVDGRVIMGLDTTQDEFFASVAEMSQCDACGKLRSGLPKMLTCGNCKVMHYCRKACQREHWKFAHRTMCTKNSSRRMPIALRPSVGKCCRCCPWEWTRPTESS